MPWPHTFGALSGDVPASYIDDNFAAAAFASDLTALTATVAALPTASIPLIAAAGGVVGVATTFARADHQHPPQQNTPNLQTGTAYTILATDDGKVVDLSNTSAITLTFLAANLQGYYSGLLIQSNTGQVTVAAGAGTTLRQASSLTKTRARWSVISWYVRTFGAGAAEVVLSGDMA